MVTSDPELSCGHCGDRHEPETKVCPRTGAPMDAPGLLGKEIDRYTVVRLLGTGGMASVYLAKHTKLGHPVALKLLPSSSSDSSAEARFDREAQASASVRNGHVVQVLDYGRTPTGKPFLVMEMLEGRTLAELLRSEAPLDPGRAIDLALQLLDGLAAAHAVGVVHRDLKPSNVIVQPLQDALSGAREHLKLLDFGISKMLVGEKGPRLTQAGVVMGTPRYMAPEQLKDSSAVDARTDLFAACVLLFEMLTGQHPFAATNLNAMLSALASDKPRSLSEVAPGMPRVFTDVVDRGLQREPADRWQSAREFSDALRPLRALFPTVSAAPAGAPPVTPQTLIRFTPQPEAPASVPPASGPEGPPAAPSSPPPRPVAPAPRPSRPSSNAVLQSSVPYAPQVSSVPPAVPPPRPAPKSSRGGLLALLLVPALGGLAAGAWSMGLLPVDRAPSRRPLAYPSVAFAMPPAPAVAPPPAPATPEPQAPPPAPPAGPELPPETALFFESAGSGGRSASLGPGAYPHLADTVLSGWSPAALRVGSEALVLLHACDGFAGTGYRVYSADDPDLAGDPWMQSSSCGAATVGGNVRALFVLRQHCTPGPDQVALFERPNLEGACVLVDPGNYMSINAVGPDDFLGSAQVGSSARVALWANANLDGTPEMYGPGQRADTLQMGDDALSSLKVTAVRRRPRPAPSE